MFHKKYHPKDMMGEWKISKYPYRLAINHEAKGQVVRGVKY